MNRWAENYRYKLTTLVTVSNKIELKEVLQKAKKTVDEKWNQKSNHSVRLSDFELMKTIGSGSYGTVMLVRYIATTKTEDMPYYAMKIMRKRRIIQTNLTKYVLMEKKILECIEFPFIIKHISHFKDNGNLYLVMEFVSGGDLFTHLKKFQRFEEPMVRFYVAQVVLAFEYLHYVGIIYRDLKPENILLGKDGFIKIADFGFAKRIHNSRTTTVCGTPEYYAPELIQNLPYSFEVDWWTMGILIFELSQGNPPFNSSNLVKLFQKIIDFDVKFPDHFSMATKKAIKDFARIDPKTRLRDVEAVKNHVFFKGIDWIALFNKGSTPPFTPKVTAEEDTRNFDHHKTENIEELPKNLYEKEFKEF